MVLNYDAEHFQLIASHKFNKEKEEDIDTDGNTDSFSRLSLSNSQPIIIGESFEE